MTQFIKLLIFQILFFTIFSSSANAYLDPGTGSVILQAIVAGVAAFFTGIIFYWRKLQIFLKKIFKQNNKNQQQK